MITLGIETSCDETAIGIIKDGKILANIVSSQVSHSKYGGVVPELAARNHIKIIVPITKLALEVAKVDLKQVDLISVTYGPGLIGALLVGLSFAKSLAISLKKPFIGINHLEGHIYALHLNDQTMHFPYLVLLVSGGHTEVIFVEEKFKYQTLAKTKDDACGEAFDKVAKLMGLPYPGGPHIEKQAAKGKLGSVKLPIPRPKNKFSFSYSGLKTAVLYYTRDNPGYNMKDVAANFQAAAIEHLIEVVSHVLDKRKVKDLGIAGGVSVNAVLRQRFADLAKKRGIRLHIPDLQYCTDNAAMIALAGADRFKKFGPSELWLDAVSRQTLDNINKT